MGESAAPPSPAASDVLSTADWAVPVDLARPGLRTRQQQLALAKEYLKSNATPMQYLDTVLVKAGIHEQNKFINWLWTTFPECGYTRSHRSLQMPPVSEADMATHVPTVVHVSALGYIRACSFRPPPGKKKTLEIPEHILMDGLAIAQHPMRVVQPEQASSQGLDTPWMDATGDATGTLVVHSLGYLEGDVMDRSKS